jgi:ketosteroid isomerase-like protein
LSASAGEFCAGADRERVIANDPQTPCATLKGMDEPADSRKPNVEIGKGRAVFVDGLRHGDTKAVASVYVDGARLVAPSAELIEGREAIEAFWQAGIDAGVVDIELEAATVECHDRVAYEIGRYVLQLRPTAGAPVLDRGRYLLVLEQQADGSWRRAVEMFNPEVSPARSVGTRLVR